MIDKIEITRSDTGHFNINFGGQEIVSTLYPGEVLYLVKDGIKRLAYFPPNHSGAIYANPISYEDFLKENKKPSKNKPSS